MKYSIDTSALIAAWSENYPPDRMPDLWEVKIEEMIENGELMAAEEVLGELEKKHDDLYRWAKKHQKMFIPIDEKIQKALTNIINKYTELVNYKTGRSGGDPWVIALAQVENCKVITGEKPSTNLSKPKIPNICTALKIPCLNILDFLRDQDLKFYIK